MTKKKAIIIDIDGTLANNMHRVHYIKGKNKDWESYNEAMDKDKRNQWCEDIIRGCCWCKVLLVTGREEKYREITKNWCLSGGGFSIKEYHEMKFCTVEWLYMRPTGDYRPDHEVKKEIYKLCIKPNYDVQFVIDDRQRVVDMWRSLGLVCLQCAHGDY